jgi:hypothetical protein
MTAASVPDQAAIGALATQHNIFTVQADDFPINETNNGGGTFQLPIYRTINPGTTRPRCSDGSPGHTYNKLGNVALLRLILNAPYNGTLTVNDPDPNADVDVVIYQNGVEVTRSDALGNETKPLSLAAGAYVLEVYESSNEFADFTGDIPIGFTCMNVSLTP